MNTRFQVLFHSPPGVLFTFPSRYCSAIGQRVVFSLGWWSTLIHTGFLVSRTTWDPYSFSPDFDYRTFTFFGLASQLLRLSFLPLRASTTAPVGPATPYVHRLWAVPYIRFGLLPFRSPLLRESLRFLFLQVLRCFTSPGSPLYDYLYLYKSGSPIRVFTDL